MKKIIVAYWKYYDLIPELKHNTEYDFSLEKQNEIFKTIIDNGMSMMVRPNMGTYEDTLLIYIDNGRFTQS